MVLLIVKSYEKTLSFILRVSENIMKTIGVFLGSSIPIGMPFEKQIKTLVAELKDISDAFIIMPGGVGTLEELNSLLIDHCLGVSKKSFVLLNINSYFDDLLNFFNNMSINVFIDSGFVGGISVIEDIGTVFETLLSFDLLKVKEFVSNDG